MTASKGAFEARGSGVGDLTRPYRVFVDESEVEGYSVTAVYVWPADVHHIRRSLQGYLIAGQRSIHFTKERDERRKVILRAITEMPVRIEVYRTCHKPRRGRPACLRALAESLQGGPCQQLVLDRNDSVIASDRQILSQVLSGRWDGTYDHLHDHEEPLLWLPDAVSWCWNKGGRWRAEVEQMNLTVIDLDV
ncbi:hypothetical protein [Actinomyces howellii]|uniref:hypothetical protein n=1 Tax=Actinomyces howellii TaxID=52771 RepID=UPI000F82A1C3|nr:hypothetical protein [Actinomyces howellii]